MPAPVTIVLPWPAAKLSANARHGHWGSRHRAVAAYREACYLAAQQVARGRKVVDGDLAVQLVFVPPTKRKRDEDGLVHRMKAGLDGVASALGVDDARFRLQQPKVLAPERGKARVELTLAVIEPPDAAAPSPLSGEAVEQK